MTKRRYLQHHAIYKQKQTADKCHLLLFFIFPEALAAAESNILIPRILVFRTIIYEENLLA